MADKTKEQLSALNNANFPNNNSGFITPQKLRDFNQDMIDSMVTDIDSILTGSITVDGTITATHFVGDGSGITGVLSSVPLGTVSGSSQVILQDTTGDLSGSRIHGPVSEAVNSISSSYSTNALSASIANSATTALIATSASHAEVADEVPFSGVTGKPTLVSGSSQIDYPLISNIPSGIISSSEQLPSGLVSGSSQVSYPELSNIPSGIVSSSEQLPAGVVSGSSQVIDILVPLNTYTSSNDTKWSNLGSQSGSFVTEDETGSFARTDINNNFIGEQTFNDITVNGTGSFAHINYVTGSATIIGDAFVVLNTDTPSLRYAGLKVIDSGSGGTASLQWDGDTDRWLIVDEQENSAYLLSGPTGSIGGETLLTDNIIPKSAVGNQLVDSNITDDGTTIGLGNNVNVDSDLNLTNAGKIELRPGSSINLYEEGLSGQSSLRFHSGSDASGTKWINFQSEPTGNGRMAIASFPENNHFMFFDPKDSVAGNQRVYIESTIEGGRQGDSPISIGASGLEVSGSTLTTGDTIIEGTNNGPGNTFQANNGNGTPILAVQNATLKGFTDVDVLVNGNTLNGGDITIAGNTKLDTIQTNSTGNVAINSATVVTGDFTANGQNITLSGSASATVFTPTFLVYNDTSQIRPSMNTQYGGAVGLYDNSGAQNEINLVLKSEEWGFPNNWTGPSISGNNPAGTYPAFIGFQNKTNWTDGRISTLFPLEVLDGAIISGSVSTEVQPLTITSLQSTIDFSETSLFELTLGAGVNTEILATNVGKGQTVNVLITQNATTAGTVSFSSDFLQPDGSAYTPTDTLGGQDILTLMTYNDTSKIYVVATNKFV